MAGLIKLVIPGLPVPWKSHGGYGKRSYNPRFKEKQEVRYSILEQLGIKNFMEAMLASGPIRLQFEFMLPIPKYLAKKKGIENGEIPHLTRPDCTNMQKFYEDCLKGVVFKDDSQVIGVASDKFYSKDPRTEIEIWLY